MYKGITVISFMCHVPGGSILFCSLMASDAVNTTVSSLSWEESFCSILQMTPIFNMLLTSDPLKNL